MEQDPITRGAYLWHDSQMLDARRTRRGVLIEIVDRPHWGLTCYMDGVVQSSLADEEVYHKMLTAPAFAELAFQQITTPYTFCIFGGGEGATARELLRDNPHVSSVDMIEWDEEVVTLFRERYPQWGRGVWNDRRLRVEFADAFEVCRQNRHRQYDWLFIDLFDVDEKDLNKVCAFLLNVFSWTRHGLTLYIGTQSPFPNLQVPMYEMLKSFLESRGFDVFFDTQHVPSFHGYAIYLRAVRA
jgi:predicted membrane-bound spermidine synthase